MKHRVCTLVCLLGLLAALPIFAADQLQRLPAPEGSEVAAAPMLAPIAIRKPGQKATFNVVYDDGEAEPGFGPVNGSGDFFDIALRFDLLRVPARVDEISVCLQRNGTDADFQGELNFFAADGPGGSPGTVIDFFSIEATGVPAGVGGAFYTYDLSEFDLNFTESNIYVGLSWDEEFEEGFFVCADDDRPTVQPGFFDTNFDGTWTSLSSVDPGYRTLMMRGVFSDVGTGPTSCVEDATTLCLNDDRFQVRMDFRTPQPQMGQGRAVELTPDTGYFWFFNQENVEVVIKVLNACSLPSNKFWVFAGGLTNVEVDITVTDTETGVVKTYQNPINTAFQPIQDTMAFDTCP